jgi:hypothetical protein
MKIKNTKTFYTGLFIFIVQILVFLRYSRTGCVSMPQVPDACGPNAVGALIAITLFAILGISFMASATVLTKSTKDKD